jgi:hypothetical protein
MKSWIEMNSLTLPNKLACTPTLMVDFLISCITESWILLSSTETLGCSKKCRTRRQSANFTFLGCTCFIKEMGFLPCLVLNSNLPTWSLFPCLLVKSFQVSSVEQWKSVSTGQKRSNTQKVFKKLTELSKMVIIYGNIDVMSIGVKVVITF